MTVEERIATWSHDNPVGFSTQRLKSAGELNQLQNVFILRYEDLTLYPDECMQKLYEYLELPYFQHDFNNIIKEVEEDLVARKDFKKLKEDLATTNKGKEDK